MSLCRETCSVLQSKNKQEVHHLQDPSWEIPAHLGLAGALWVCWAAAGWICGALLSLGVAPHRWPLPLRKCDAGDKAQEEALRNTLPSCVLSTGVPVASTCRRKLGYTDLPSSRARHSSGTDSRGVFGWQQRMSGSSPFQPLGTYFQLCLGCKFWRKRPLERAATNLFDKGESLETVRWPKWLLVPSFEGWGKRGIRACHHSHKNVLIFLSVSLHLCWLLALPLDTSIVRGFASPPFKVL